MFNKDLLLTGKTGQTIPLPDPPDDQHDWITEFFYPENNGAYTGVSSDIGLGTPLKGLRNFYWQNGTKNFVTEAKIVCLYLRFDINTWIGPQEMNPDGGTLVEVLRDFIESEANNFDGQSVFAISYTFD